MAAAVLRALYTAVGPLVHAPRGVVLAVGSGTQGKPWGTEGKVQTARYIIRSTLLLGPSPPWG